MRICCDSDEANFIMLVKVHMASLEWCIEVKRDGEGYVMAILCIN
jgi:hypothetical protein